MYQLVLRFARKLNLKPGKAGIMQIADNQQAINTANDILTKFKKHGVPNEVIKTENDVKIIYNQIINIEDQQLRRNVISPGDPRYKEVTEKIFGKKTGDVVDMKGNKIKNTENIVGGEEVITDVVSDTVTNMKAMTPLDAMKEANLVIGRKGKYKNLTIEQSQDILKKTDDHIFERFSSGGRTGFFTGALADTEQGKSMSPGTSHDYSPGQGHRATAEANKQLAEINKFHNMKAASMEWKPPKKSIKDKIGGGISSFFNNPLVRSYAALGTGGASEKLRSAMMAKQLYDNRHILGDEAIEEEVYDIPTMGGITPAYAQGGRTGTGLNYLLGEDDQNSRVPYGGGGSGQPPITFSITGGGSYAKNKIGPGLDLTQSGYGFDLGANLDLPWGLSVQGSAGIGRGKAEVDYNNQNVFTGVDETKLGDKWNVGIKGKWPVNFNKMFMKDGGRIGLKKGHSPGRRKFLKVAAGLATLPIVGKYFKWAKPLAKTAKVADLTSVPIGNAAGMPAWFKPLVNKVIKEGEEIGSGAERVIVHKTKLPNSKTDVYVTQDLNTGDVAVDVGMGKHGFAEGHLGQPVRLEYKASEVIEPTHIENIKRGERFKETGKPTKTKEEFWVEEAEFTGGHPENIKFEESTIEKFGDHGSNFDEVEMFATGKVKKKKPLKKAERTEYESGKAEADAEAAADMADDFASGGRVPLGGGGGIMKLLKLLKKKPKKSYKRIDLEKLLKGDKKIPVYSGSMKRQSNTWQSFIEDAKLLGTTPEKIAKDKFKGQWFTPFRDYAESFIDPKDLTSKMRTVELDPKEIAIAKRYVDKVNKTDIISMRKKLGIKPYPKQTITTDENLVLIPKYKLKKLKKENRIMTDYLIKEKIKSKLGLAEGGVAGLLGE
jgi:hypothetical protein